MNPYSVFKFMNGLRGSKREKKKAEDDALPERIYK